MTHRILVIDDDPKILETCRSVLAPEANVAGEELQAMADSLFGTQRVAPEEGVGKVRQHFEVTTVNQGLLKAWMKQSGRTKLANRFQLPSSICECLQALMA